MMVHLQHLLLTGFALFQVGHAAAPPCKGPGCHDKPGHGEKYMDASLPPAKRAEDLLRRMTWEEKIGQMGGVRRAFTSVDKKPVFNRTAFDLIHAKENGQIGMATAMFFMPSNLRPF